MVWLILFFVCLIVTIVMTVKYCTEELVIIIIIADIVFLITSVVILSLGINYYPSLVSQKEKIIMMKKHVINIKNAYYKNC